MTAIAIFRLDDGVVIASDGAAYASTTGCLTGLTSKVVLAPEWSCVLAQRGAGGVVQLIRSRIGFEVLTFDDLLDVIVGVAIDVYDSYKVFGYDDDARFSLFLAGWSETRERFETYQLRTHGHEAHAEGTGEVLVVEPFQLTPLPFVYLAPGGGEHMERFGVMEAIAANDPIPATVRAVCAARQLRNVSDEAAEHCVGGFIQLTIVRRDKVESTIVHRWPDVIGEPIDPTRGEPLPAFLSVPADE